MPSTIQLKKRREAIRKQNKRRMEKYRAKQAVLKRKNQREKERIRKAKKPRLLASNPLVKEIYALNRRIEASGTNLSDWREEMYCERPGASVEDFKRCIAEENKLVDKLQKKLDRLFKKVLKEYGKEQQGALYEFIDYPIRYTRGTEFGSMTYKEKQKVHISNV